MSRVRPYGRVESCHCPERWMVDIRIECMNESCHTYEWVMSHIWMSHVTLAIQRPRTRSAAARQHSHIRIMYVTLRKGGRSVSTLGSALRPRSVREILTYLLPNRRTSDSAGACCGGPSLRFAMRKSYYWSPPSVFIKTLHVHVLPRNARWVWPTHNLTPAGHLGRNYLETFFQILALTDWSSA